MKKSKKRLVLRRETLGELGQVSGALSLDDSRCFCVTTEPCAYSLAFTNCNQCPTHTCTPGGGGGRTILFPF